MPLEDDHLRRPPAPRLERWRSASREKKPGITYGTQTSAAAEDLTTHPLAVFLIREREHRIRVRVIDELAGKNACSNVSTLGVGAEGSTSADRSSDTMSSSESDASDRSARSGSRRTAGCPAGAIVAKSQPDPLMYNTSISRPARLRAVSFAEVLPPPCTTSRACPEETRRVRAMPEHVADAELLHRARRVRVFVSTLHQDRFASGAPTRFSAFAALTSVVRLTRRRSNGIPSHPAGA